MRYLALLAILQLGYRLIMVQAASTCTSRQWRKLFTIALSGISDQTLTSLFTSLKYIKNISYFVILHIIGSQEQWKNTAAYQPTKWKMTASVSKQQKAMRLSIAMLRAFSYGLSHNLTSLLYPHSPFTWSVVARGPFCLCLVLVRDLWTSSSFPVVSLPAVHLVFNPCTLLQDKSQAHLCFHCQITCLPLFTAALAKLECLHCCAQFIDLSLCVELQTPISVQPDLCWVCTQLDSNFKNSPTSGHTEFSSQEQHPGPFLSCSLSLHK